jgi:hypothetical protein
MIKRAYKDILFIDSKKNDIKAKIRSISQNTNNKNYINNLKTDLYNFDKDVK